MLSLLNGRKGALISGLLILLILLLIDEDVKLQFFNQNDSTKIILKEQNTTIDNDTGKTLREFLLQHISITKPNITTKIKYKSESSSKWRGGYGSLAKTDLSLHRADPKPSALQSVSAMDSHLRACNLTVPDDRRVLLLTNVQALHGSTASLSLLMSSPQVSTLCRNRLHQCEGFMTAMRDVCEKIGGGYCFRDGGKFHGLSSTSPFLDPSRYSVLDRHSVSWIGTVCPGI